MKELKIDKEELKELASSQIAKEEWKQFERNFTYYYQVEEFKNKVKNNKGTGFNPDDIDFSFASNPLRTDNSLNEGIQESDYYNEGVLVDASKKGDTNFDEW